MQPPDPSMSQGFSKARTGLREIAFRVAGRSTVDLIAPEIEAHGGKIVDPPREYDYRPDTTRSFSRTPTESN